MTVKIFRNEKFEFPHENIVFDEMIGELEKQWSDSKDLVVMLGNIYTNGTQIDALIVKKDAISIIDFKNYGGEISFSENGSWKANGVEIKMSGRINPYLQILNAKFSLVDKLKTNPIFKKGNEVNLGHITGIVLFHQHIKFDSHSIPSRISWFHVIDIFNSVKLLDNITSKQIKLSDQEIECFSGLFDLKQYEFSRPKITIEEDKFINQELLVNELYILNDLYKSIEIVKVEGEKLVKRHNEFINHFYPSWNEGKGMPEVMKYHLSHFHNKYASYTEQFILKQNEQIQNQIKRVYNLNTNNGFILNEYSKNKEITDVISTKNELSSIISKIQEKFKIQKSTSNLNLLSLKAYFDVFYERGLYDEKPFDLIRKELLKNEKLINIFHGLYVVLKKWFGSEMISQHVIESSIKSRSGLDEIPDFVDINDFSQEEIEKLSKEIILKEEFTTIKEYKFARGISDRWYANMMKQFAEEELIEYFEVSDMSGLHSYSVDNKCFEPDEKIKLIASVSLPKKIIDIFEKLRIELEKVLKTEEVNQILEFMDLSWIKKGSIDIRRIHILNLENHLIYSTLNNIDFLQKPSIFPNSGLYEPFYLTCLEKIFLWNWKDLSLDTELYKLSYKTLIPDIVLGIEYINSKESGFLPSYKRGLYPFSNYISVKEVSDKCLVPVNIIVEFLDSIGLNYSDRFRRGRYGIDQSVDDVQANYDYKVLLKRFKTITSVLPSDKLISTKSIKSNNQAIIGYNDIKKYIKKRLEPYKNPEQAKRFALKKIGGVILYGPPGCGKTLWATQIAKYLGLKFEEIPRSIFGSTYHDGAMKGLETKLDEVEKKAPIAIFFDEFDSIGTARENESGSNDENRKVVNTLLQRIPKLIEKGIIVLAATNFINDLDSALIRPGRFDLHIPIMLPLPKERAEIIHHYLTENYPEAVLRILSNNSANDSDYWKDYAEIMYLFSNSHVLDFCNELKDYMLEQSVITELDEIALTDDIIFDLINRVKSKIRKKDIDLHKRFYAESINLMDVFKERMERLKYEIDKFDNNKGNNYRPVGFKPLK